MKIRFGKRSLSNVLLVGLAFCWGCTGLSAETQKKPADYVDPWIESAQSRYFYFNSACRPFGMVNLSPDTQPIGEWRSGYRYNDQHVYGLCHIHYWRAGGLMVMPTMDIDPVQGPDGWKSRFSHEGEIVKAGYHKLHLDDYDIDVELTATDRVGFHRYTFNQTGTADIMVWLGGQLGFGKMIDAHIDRTGEREITGWVVQKGRQTDLANSGKLHFVIQVDTAPASWHAWRGNEQLGKLDKNVSGRDSGAYARFKVTKGDQILLKAGLSWCGVKQARENLETELNHWDFDRIHRASLNEWNDWLNRIEVKGGTEKQRIKFYTDLWHALLGRRQLQDVCGTYPDRLDGVRKVGQLPVDKEGRYQFMHLNTDSWWLSKWNLNTLWGLAWPHVLEDVCNSSLVYYTDGGRLPRGPSLGEYTDVMTGCPITELIVSAYMKGIRGFDTELALEAMVKGHTEPGNTMDARWGQIDKYIELGYIPYKKDLFGETGRTMEHTSQDWALAQYAKALGREDIYKTFMKRSENWRNVFDPETGFVRARMADGSWLEPFDPLRDSKKKGFVEANSWQTTWIATHDVQGLANLLGGRDAYCKKLNDAFENSRKAKFVGDHGQGYVSYANQPGCGAAHMFNYAGQPWLSQYWVRQVNEHTYGGTTPDSGYGAHDEDQGQMGGVSALMSIGLFQVRGGCDVEPIYELTAPVFDEITIHLDQNFYSGKTFRIVARNNTPENVYIQSAKLNGKPLDNCWFYHRDFARGGTLELVLGPEPNKSWGVNELPPSVSREKLECTK
ncbi:MAG: GH92 family glycosyl hydrolase [Planctomycetota bacterium]|jgi:predicted alpha-1,2-mannosidase